jgi:threonine/homoserine/homoserine lactone efflux protein
MILTMLALPFIILGIFIKPHTVDSMRCVAINFVSKQPFCFPADSLGPEVIRYGALVAASPAIHTAMQVAGGAYMLWLAWKVANAGQPKKVEGGGGRPLTFLEAAAFQWVNPKGLLTSLGAVALFVRPATALFDATVMIAVFALSTTLAVVVWTAFGTVVARALRNPLHARIFNIVMALLLVASIVPMVM